MMRTLAIAFIVSLSFVLAPHARPVQAQPSATAPSRVERVSDEVVPATEGAKTTPSARWPRVSRVTRIELGALGPAERHVPKSAPAQGDADAPLQIGLRRAVPELAGVAGMASRLEWQATESGSAAAVSINSPGAVALRFGILVDAMPSGAMLRFHSPLSGQQAEVSGAEIMRIIALNLASGETGDRPRTYWSAFIEGPEVTFEIFLPAGTRPGEARFSIPAVSHFFALPYDAEISIPKGIGTSDSCNIDSTCHSATWGSQSRATAKMTFVVDGLGYLCSGTLLNDTVTTSFIPYFLSAYHCLSTQSVASTLNTFWFYRSTSCNSGILDSASVRLSGGATLLYSNRNTDTLFLRLNDPAPAGSVLSGWSAALPAIAQSVTGVHHPDGDLQKISFGQIIDYSDCISAAGSSFSCAGVSATEADYFKVRYEQGTTQGGSSGSGLWVTQDGSRYLVGQLRGGSGSCASPPPTKYYGRFDRAYVASLRSFLSPESANYTLSVSRAGAGSGTVTSSIAGISCGSDCSESYPSGTTILLIATASPGSAFAGWSGACTGTGSCQLTMTSARSVTATFSACSYSFSPSSLSVGSAGGSGTIGVATAAGCAWTAGSVESWLSANGSGNGNGSFQYAVGANTAATARTGNLTAAGRAIAVTQAGRSTAITTTNAVSNGGFENGAASWTQSSTAGSIVQSNAAGEARSGSGYAWLGGYDSGTDVLSQDVTIAAGAEQASLRFWYRIRTAETTSSTAYDTLSVRVVDASSGATLATLASLSNLNATTGWVQSQAFDLTSYRGRGIRLVFRAVTDVSNITSFLIDDVELSVTSASGTAANYTALWWNPAESGWGLNLVHQGDTIFASLFTYDSTGAPLWLFMSNGVKQSGTATFSGRFYRAVGPPFNAVPFRPITSADLTDVGSMTIEFSGGDSARLTYTVNGSRVEKTIQRQVFGSRAANCSPWSGSRSALVNYQDLWWNPNESGWGINLTHQDNIIFASLFTYGLDGRGVWYFMSAGVRQADGSFRGELYRASGPSFDAQPFRPITAANLTQVGSMQIRFSDGENATLSYSVNGAPVVKNIVRQVFSSPVTACQ